MKIKQIINQHNENHLNEKTLKESLVEKTEELQSRVDNVKLRQDEDRQAEYKYELAVLKDLSASCGFRRSAFTDKVCEKIKDTGLSFKSDKEGGKTLYERLALTEKI
ncbi:MAG: hypothetical protein ACJAW3_001318, partial [Lentimonas sp.]